MARVECTLANSISHLGPTQCSEVFLSKIATQDQTYKLTSASLYPSELEPMGILIPLTSLPSAHAFFHTPSPASVEVELKRVDEMAQ